jgi:uncharacterized protein (DUF1330 family)
MAAYLVGDIEITDPAGYEEYKRQVPATIAAYGGRYLSRAGALEVLEGRWLPQRAVILEFPTMAQLKSWYNSPEYRPLREIRGRAARSNLVAIEGV